MNQLLYNRPLPGARLDMSHPLTRDLQCFWLMNENGGRRVMDISPYGNHGLFASAAEPAKRPFNGMIFDGTNDFISTSVTWNPLKATTICAWVNLATTAGATASTVITNRESGVNTDALELIYNINNNAWGMACFDDAAAQNNINDTVAPKLDQWYFVVGVYKPGASITLYVDGTQRNTAAQGALSSSQAQPFYISAFPNGGAGFRNFPGRIANVMIYRRALLPNEIADLYQNPYGMVMQ